MTSHSPQAEAAALVAEARQAAADHAYDDPDDYLATLLRRLADALGLAVAALAVKREADREAVRAAIESYDSAAAHDDGLIEAVLGVIREAPPKVPHPALEVTDEMVEAACATDPLWDDYGPESKTASGKAMRVALTAALEGRQ